MNHISKAKRAIDLSKFDQENLRLKVDEWQKGNLTSSFYFRPFGKEMSGTRESAGTLETEQTFLYIHQEEWQRDLLRTYGNIITLMDATYKTTNYSIPLFFVCVKTNVNYTLVAEFVVQSETTEQIFEALSIITSWVTDYSDAEMSAISMLFSNTQLYLCEFHREQAWERWVKDRKHGLNEIQAASLLDLLRDYANAPVNRIFEDEPPDHLN